MKAIPMYRSKLVKLSLSESIRRFAGRGEDAASGLAALEFGLVAPMIGAIMLCATDLGVGVYRNMQVQNAAQMGAEYARIHGFNADAISNAVMSATNLTGISASPAPTQFCGCASAAGIGVADCSSPCSGGGSPGIYVSVTAQATYNTLFPYPGIPATFNIVQQATVRIQ